MTLQELLNAVRRYLDDDSEYRYSNEDELIMYINIGYAHYYYDLINKGYRRLLKHSDLTITDGLGAIPSDFYMANNAYEIFTDTYVPIPFFTNYEYSESTTSSRFSYSFEGNFFKFNGYDSGTAKIVYYPTMTNLSLFTDSPVTAFLPNWHDLIPVYAAIIAKGGREEDDTSGLERIQAKLEKPYNDYIIKMTNSRSYVHPFYT